MKTSRFILSVLLSLAAPSFAAVTVTSPQPGSTVSSPVQYTASATAPTCPTGVHSMGIYINNKLTYIAHNTAQLNTQLSLPAGAQHTVVEEWDNCGGATYTTVNITVTNPTSGPAGVVVTSPTPNSTVTSPVQYTASATAPSCATGVHSMGIYIDNKLTYIAHDTAQLNTQLSLPTGAQHTVVEEWDNCGGASYTTVNLTVQQSGTSPTVTLTANPPSISSGSSSTLTATATNATEVVITGTDGSRYTLGGSGGTQSVSPTSTTTYTAQASGSYGSTTATTTLEVQPAGSATAIQHVVFMLQENHSFDNYFGMLNPYRQANGWNVGQDGKTYNVDGVDDKLTTIVNKDDEGTAYKLFKFTTTCVDDETSGWLESYGDVSRWNFTPTRPINMDGFVHDAEGFAKSCTAPGASCSGSFTDLTGERAMGYYDQTFLNYYYYMASQFAISDRWFSPISSKSVSNRIATMTGGTTQGLVQDPGSNDHLPPLDIANIYQELDKANVSWKIYYTSTDGFCLAGGDCPGGGAADYPAIYFNHLTYAYQYVHGNPSKATCTAPLQPSSVVGDTTNSFCIDPNKIAPLSQYFKDVANGTLPSFAFIEAGYGLNDEHPGSGSSILGGQAQVAKVINAFMAGPEWKNSVFFFSYDEGGGPYDHVPPVPGHSNQNTDSSLGTIPDVSSIAVNADGYKPCLPSSGTATLHCDLTPNDPGAHSGDAPALQGFAAQLGFRVPNMIISPFVRKHYVSHTPMDHTAIIRFVENRFIGSSAHLTTRDYAQPNLLEFFDFSGVPWATPPTPPAPVSNTSLGYNSCQASNMGP